MKLVLGKYVQYFILESGENLENYLNKLNQKEENEIEFDIKNEIKRLNKNNININNIRIQKDETKKQRKIDNNLININNYNLEKKKDFQDKNEIISTKSIDNENFLGVFEEEKEEKEIKQKKINNNWMNITKETEGNNNINNINNINKINLVPEFDELEEKRKMSSNQLSFKNNNKTQHIKDKKAYGKIMLSW